MKVETLGQQEARLLRYNHARYELQRRFLRFLIRHIGLTLLARVERVEGLENIPKTGPAILMINHIAFIDSLIVLHLVPRNIIPMAKVEVYEYPVLGIFPRIWHVIPVRREEVDRRAIRMALEVLAAGEIILVAPEGTRGTELRKGREGVAYLASRSGAPIIPVGIENTPGFPTFRYSKRWRGPGPIIKFGKPFRYKAAYSKPTREQLRQMTDEAMFELAKLVSEHRRGIYSDLSQATRETIEAGDL